MEQPIPYHNDAAYREYIIEKCKRAQKAMLKVNCFSADKINEFVNEGKLTSYQGRLALKMMRLTESVFPGKCDLSFTVYPKFGIHENIYGIGNRRFVMFQGFAFSALKIIIHYPEIEIRNSSRKTHTIRDLYVILPITFDINDPTFAEAQRIMGYRATVTTKEMQAKYLHSHLPRKFLTTKFKRTIPDSFCTGTGPINLCEADLNGSLRTWRNNIDLFDEDIFLSYLMHITPYVKWESLEGRPHIRMAEIGTRRYDIPSPDRNDLKMCFDVLTKGMPTTTGGVRLPPVGDVRTLSWNYTNKTYTIRKDDNFQVYLRKLMPIFPQWFFLKESDTGNLYKRPTGIVAQQYLDTQGEYTYFRGQPRQFNIIIDSIPDEEPSEENYFIHPQIEVYVKSTLEHQASIQSSQQGYATILAKVETNRLRYGQDQVLVHEVTQG